jgi:hypothetical protein
MPQQELNLLDLTTTVVAQLRTSSAQVVWCNVVQSCFLTATPDYVPDHVLRNAMAPHFSFTGDRPEDLALCDVGSASPLIERGFDPVWYGYGTNVAAFANQINHSPVALAHLDLVQL